MSPSELVAAQVDAYNAQDLDKFVGFYADDCVIADLNGEVRFPNRVAIRARFAETFAKFPQNRARILKRIAVGNIVVDHEVGERSPGGDSFELVAVYTIKNGKIARLDMTKGE
jgi:hypothetical protein